MGSSRPPTERPQVAPASAGGRRCTDGPSGGRRCTDGPSGGEPRGFTLLEVMIALAILAMSFTALLGTQSQALIITSYIRDVSVAGLLARGKLVELEHHYKTEGFGTFDEEEDGDFGDEGYPKFRWSVKLEKIEADEGVLEEITSQLPQDPEAIKEQMTASGPFAGADLGGLNFNPSMVFQGLPMFLEQLGEKVRRVTFEVQWPEGRKGKRSMSVNTFFVLFEEIQKKADDAETVKDALGGGDDDGSANTSNDGSKNTSKTLGGGVTK